VPLTFLFEFTRANERLHCHGAAILPATDDDTLKLFREVLKKAGGIVKGLGSGRQCDVTDLYDAIGWHGYCSKEAARTRRLLGTDKIHHVSADLRKATEDDHNARRAAVTAKTKRKQPTVTHTAPTTTSPAPEDSKTAHDSQRSAMARFQRVRDDFTIVEADIPAATPYSAALMAEIDALLDAL